MAETKKLNIFQKLSAISNELSTVAKNLEVGYGQSKYKAVSEADILNAVKPLEAKHGVYSYPLTRTVIESGTIENIDKTGVIKKQLFERIEVVYRFVNIEDPDDHLDITSYGDGIDPQDKSVGKAMTYADKYALMKAYKIVTGDDPDQFQSEDLHEIKVTKVKQPLNQEMIAKCTALGIKLDDIASFLKKSVDELTDTDITRILVAKQKKDAKKQVAQVAPQEPSKENTKAKDEDWI